MRKSTALIFGIIMLVVTTTTVEAKKILPRAIKANTSTAPKVTTTTSRGVSTKVSFMPGKRGIRANFSNLSIAQSVSYMLTYESRGTTQGAVGTVAANEADGTVRELIFGTCSHGVCRYDSGITNAKFIVTTTLKNGKKVVKSFKLRV